MNAVRPNGGGRRRSTAPRAGRGRGGRGTGPERGKLADPDRVAGAVVRPRAGQRAALRGFRSGQRGASTIGAAVGISILVATLAVLVGIVHKIYIEDRMGRGVRAGVRAVSLAATAPASEEALKDIVCKAVRRELGEDEGNACVCWSIDVEAFETPQALSEGNARGSGTPHGGESADMIVVRLRLPYPNWLSLPAAADPDADRCPPVDPDASSPAEIVVAAVARNEREVRDGS